MHFTPALPLPAQVVRNLCYSAAALGRAVLCDLQAWAIQRYGCNVSSG